MARSSAASTTNVRTGAPAAVISSPRDPSSIDTPIHSSAPAARARTTGECSPTPPVNTERVEATQRRDAPAQPGSRTGASTRRARAPRRHRRHRRGRPPRACRSVPHRPSSPLSVLEHVATGPRRCARCRHSTAPGSIAPQRVAITRPSSGVKPIVVVTLRPSTTPHSDWPPPRCATSTRRASGRERRDPTGRPRVRQPVEPVHPHLLAQLEPAARRCGPPPGWSCGTRCRSRRPAARRASAARHRVERVERGGLVQRSELGRAPPARRARRRRRRPRAVRSPPCTTRCTTASTPSVGPAERVFERVERRDPRRRPRRRETFIEVEPALTVEQAHAVSPARSSRPPRRCPRRARASTPAPAAGRRPSR